MDHKLLVVYISFGFGFISCSYGHTFPLEYHYVSLPVNWADAQNYCRVNYTDLVTIEGMDDISRLNRPNADTSLAWIGLNDDPLSWKGVMGNDVNSWRWSATGKTNEHGFQTWASGQPNNANGNQFCVVMNIDGKWNDQACDYVTSFVCYTVTNSTGQSTYTLITDALAQGDALNYCRTYHTDLVMIENANQNTAISSLTSSLIVWIGLYRVPWKWSDKSSSSFKNWQNGEPNNYYGNEFCAAETSAHFWMDMSCNTKYPFWCYRATPQPMAMVTTKIQTDGDISDSTTNAQIIQQLGAVLKNALPADILVGWKMQPKKQEETSTLSDTDCISTVKEN